MTDALRSRAGLFAVSGGALLWGTTGVPVAVIHARTGLSAVAIGCLRLLVATIVVLPLFVHRRAQLRAAIAKDRWWLVVAGVGLGAFQALYFVGIQYVGVSVSTLVSLGVAPVALTAWTAVQRRALPGSFASLTVLAALAGLTMISLGPGTPAHAPHPGWGLAASFGSGLAYAASTVLNHRLAGTGDPLLLTGTSSVVGALALLPVALVPGLWWPSDAIASGWLVYIGVMTTVVAYALFYLGLQSVPSETAGVLTLLEPLAAAILAVIVLHERLSALAVGGGALMLAAIAGLYARPPRALHEVEPELTPR